MTDTNISKQPSEDDILLGVALQEGKHGFTSMLATGQIFLERGLDPYALANQALGADDQIQTPLSGVPVFYQRGATLEQIAQQYLGDPNRAREIAILNDLRAPYIDEEGFDLPITNASGRAFVVESDADLAFNQAITIQSTSVASTQRRILNIEDIGGQFRVTVDGPDNLSIYTAGSSPSLHVRLPGTIGSGDILLIPDQNTPPLDVLSSRPSPLGSKLSHAEKVFKIDLALDEKHGMDIATSATGDVKRSFGYANAVQAIRLAIEVELKELDQHPGYGLPIPIGARNGDITPDQLKGLIKQTIQRDPRFVNATAQITIDGSVVRVEIDVQGAGGTGRIPLEFEIGRVTS